MDETISRITIEIGASSDGAEQKINEVSSALRSMKGHTRQSVRVDTKDVDRAHKKIGALTQTLNALKRIAFYRIVRSAIKAVGEAFSEGAENAYWYSKTVGDTTRYIADAYDNLSSGSFKMSNQLGAAWATLKATLEPVLMSIINLVTQAASAITQFFAALGGRTSYLKAIDYSKAWADTTKSGAAAAKEWKNQLLGFDEINRLEEPGKGGGGGGGAALPDYENMFEELPLDKWTEKIAKIKDRMLELWELLKTGAVSAWNYIKEHVDFEKLFDDICLVIEGAVEFVSGILSGDFAAAFMGAAHIVEGFGGVVDQVLGFISGLVSLYFDEIARYVNSFFDWLEEKTGIDFTLLRDALLVWVDSVKTLFSDLFDSIKTVFDGLITFITGVFAADWGKAWDGLVEIFRGVLNLGVSLVEFGINTVINGINAVLGFAQGVVDALGGTFSLTIQPLILPRFATGGFPEDGLFMANHGELVGQFSNGRTAVANNEQITEGIAKAVYEAFVEAFTQTNGSNGNGQPVNIYLDGKQIATTTTKYQTQMARATG